MAEFINKTEAQTLLEILETGITENRKRPNAFPQPGEHPLYEFKSSKSGNRYAIPIVQQVFDLLGKNKYGGSYVQKTEEDLKNGFRAGLSSLKPDWIGGLEMAEFDKFVYFFNYQQQKGLTTIHYLPERICDGTLHAILKRAMELGKFEKPVAAVAAPKPSVPAP